MGILNIDMDLMSTANAAGVFGLLCFMVVKEVLTKKNGNGNGNGGTNGKVSRTEHEMLIKLTKIEAHQEKTCELLQQMVDRI